MEIETETETATEEEVNANELELDNRIEEMTRMCAETEEEINGANRRIYSMQNGKDYGKDKFDEELKILEKELEESKARDNKRYED